MKKLLIPFLTVLTACEGALDPLNDGAYTDENIGDYPSMLKGFVDEAYALTNISTYIQSEFIYLDCATDDAVASSSTNALRKMAGGSLSPADDPFYTYWKRDYQGIYYVNRFLEDDKGLNTKYMRDSVQDSLIRHNYQGDAYALRAWFQYDLLLKFGGKSTGGSLLGFPIVTSVQDPVTADYTTVVRASYEDCVRQIISDCDEALKYLPLVNRDWNTSFTAVQGSCRWGRFDQMSVWALKAMTYLLWSSDAFNPTKDPARWAKTAEFAAMAIKIKMDEDGHNGFLPMAALSWTDPNSGEAYWTSRASGTTTNYEVNQYPAGFQGTCRYAPSQELVDAFPAANGYPIDDTRSGYDPKHPYLNRDPRFYATVFYHGEDVLRSGTADDVMYRFDMSASGKDFAGLTGNSLTGYYLKKFVYLGWNGSDQSVQSMPRTVIHIGWRDICLTFAEAACRAVGPTDKTTYGYSAKQMLAYMRSRTTSDGKPGLGYTSDPYLDECAMDSDKFESLVRNERRIEFCFEGKRFHDLTRWGVSLSERNKSVHKVKVITSGANVAFSTAVADKRSLTSKYLPIPYTESLNAPGLEQNEGWDNWK